MSMPTPAPAQKKSHKARKILLAAVALGAVITIASNVHGGSSDKSNNSSHKESSGVSQGLGAHDASGDVTLAAKPTKDDAGMVHMAVSFHNTSSKRSDYYVDLALQSADGKTQYDTTIATAENVEAGQNAHDDAVFLEGDNAPAGAVVVVKSVQRTASI
jgi:hypothetical protein